MSHLDLDDVRVASPCSASWDDMIGDDRVRFCQLCTKNVYNLSALSREDAEALLRADQEREGPRGEGMCIRLYRRADGTVLTADCPDGARRKKRRLALFGAVGGGLMAAGAAAAELSGGGAAIGSPLPPSPPTMGAVATMGEAPAPPIAPAPVATDAPEPRWIAGGMLPPAPPKVSPRKPAVMGRRVAPPEMNMGLYVTGLR
jgi:hypothetical protein